MSPERATSGSGGGAPVQRAKRACARSESTSLEEAEVADEGDEQEEAREPQDDVEVHLSLSPSARRHARGWWTRSSRTLASLAEQGPLPLSRSSLVLDSSGVRHLDLFRMPLVVVALHDCERIRVHDDHAIDVADVEEVEAARSGAAGLERGLLLVERAVARAVELVLRLVPRDGAAEVYALAVRGGDRPGAVDEEEPALLVEDRLVIGALELREDVALLAGGHLGAEALDLDDAEEWEERRAELGDREERCGEEADTQELAPLDARQQPTARDGRISVRTDHLMHRLVALMRLGQRPGGVKIHARATHRRADDRQYDVGHDEAGEDRHHPLPRTRSEEALAQLHQDDRKEQHQDRKSTRLNSS